MRFGKNATMAAATAPTHGLNIRQASRPIMAMVAVPSTRLKYDAASGRLSGIGECCTTQNTRASTPG